MLRKRFIFQTLKATMSMWSDYSKTFFHIILVFLDALRTPNYSSEEIISKSCKIHKALHKHFGVSYIVKFGIFTTYKQLSIFDYHYFAGYNNVYITLL